MPARLPRPLTRTCAALAYERKKILDRLLEIDRELRAIDYAIKLIDPAWKPSKKGTQPATPPRMPRGKVSATCLSILRTHPGISSAELAARRLFTYRPNPPDLAHI